MPRKTITAFLDYMSDEKAASTNTIESYRRDLETYASYCSSVDINNLSAATQDIVQRFVGHLTDCGKSANTIARNVSSLRSFYQYLILVGQLNANPAKGLKLAKAERKLPEILTSEEVGLLLEQPTCNCPKGFRDKAMLELLYATGIKVSELVDLNVSDINIPLGVIKCQNAKSGRLIPMYPAAARAMDEYINKVRPLMLEDNTEALFVNINGARLTRQGFWKIIKEYAKSAGINKDITPQTIRHSFASHLLENGADIKSIQEMLGHTDISSTQFYAKIIKNKYKNVYNKFHPRA